MQVTLTGIVSEVAVSADGTTASVTLALNSPNNPNAHATLTLTGLNPSALPQVLTTASVSVSVG